MRKLDPIKAQRLAEEIRQRAEAEEARVAGIIGARLTPNRVEPVVLELQ